MLTLQMQATSARRTILPGSSGAGADSWSCWGHRPSTGMSLLPIVAEHPLRVCNVKSTVELLRRFICRMLWGRKSLWP